MSFDTKKYLERNSVPNTNPDLGIQKEDFDNGTDELETLLRDEGQINSVCYEISMEKKVDSTNKK